MLSNLSYLQGQGQQKKLRNANEKGEGKAKTKKSSGEKTKKRGNGGEHYGRENRQHDMYSFYSFPSSSALMNHAQICEPRSACCE